MQTASTPESPAESIHRWQVRMFWLMWGTYVSFYLVRVNISVAVPEIMATHALSRTEMGLVLSSQFFLYAIGQAINGQLGDWIDPRRFVAAGLLASAILNVLFGFTAGSLTAMIVVWGLNGYFQSMGWGPIVKTMANWFPAHRRSLVAGRLATSYILGAAISWLVAGTLIAHLSWPHVFWWPASLAAAAALHWLARARKAPEELGLASAEEQERGSMVPAEGVAEGYIGLRATLRLSLANPWAWTAAFALFGLNVVRYGFMDWAPTFFVETFGAGSGLAAYQSMAFPLAGAVGAVTTGWLCQRLGPRRQGLVGAAMLLLLALGCWAFPEASKAGAVVSFATLTALGFLTFGPHMLLIAALPPALGTRRAASSVTGFIDAVGYAGAALTGGVTGFLIDRFGWSAASYFWIGGALFSAVMMTLVGRWVSRPRGIGSRSSPTGPGRGPTASGGSS